MPAVSKKQQRLMGMAYAYRRGELEINKLPKPVREIVKNIAKTMKLKDLEKYASTKRSDLPEKVSEYNIIVPSFKETLLLTEAVTKEFFEKWVVNLLPSNQRSVFKPGEEVVLKISSSEPIIQFFKQNEEKIPVFAVRVPVSVYQRIADAIKQFKTIKWRGD